MVQLSDLPHTKLNRLSEEPHEFDIIFELFGNRYRVGTQVGRACEAGAQLSDYEFSAQVGISVST